MPTLKEKLKAAIERSQQKGDSRRYGKIDAIREQASEIRSNSRELDGKAYGYGMAKATKLENKAGKKELKQFGKEIGRTVRNEKKMERKEKRNASLGSAVKGLKNSMVDRKMETGTLQSSIKKGVKQVKKRN
jgi:hypothetical protein